MAEANNANATADADNAAAVAAAAATEILTEKIPLFYGTSKDVMTPKNWLVRVKRIRAKQRWNDEQTITSCAQALREMAEDWFQWDIGEKLDEGKTVTFAEFERRFLIFTGGNASSFKGFLQWPQMLAPRNGKNLNEYFINIAKSSSEWHKGRKPAAEPRPAAWVGYYPTEITSHRHFTSIDPDLIQQIRVFERKEERRETLEEITTALFYYGLSTNAREYLRDKDVDTLWDIREMIQKFELDNKVNKLPASASVAAIDDVDAFKQGKKQTGPRQQTGPSKKKSITCYYCKKFGHGQQDCRTRIRKGAEMVKPPARTNEMEETASNSENPLNF